MILNKYVWIYSVSNIALQDILCWIRTETVHRKLWVTNLSKIVCSTNQSLSVYREISMLCLPSFSFSFLSPSLLSSPSLLPPPPKTSSFIEKKSGNTSSFSTCYPWVMTPIFLYVLKVSEVAQLCPTLCDPVDCSPPGSSIHGILQARILESVAISFSMGSSQPRDRTQVFRIAGRRFTL